MIFFDTFDNFQHTTVLPDGWKHLQTHGNRIVRLGVTTVKPRSLQLGLNLQTAYGMAPMEQCKGTKIAGEIFFDISDLSQPSATFLDT